MADDEPLEVKQERKRRAQEEEARWEREIRRSGGDVKAALAAMGLGGTKGTGGMRFHSLYGPGGLYSTYGLSVDPNWEYAWTGQVVDPAGNAIPAVSAEAPYGRKRNKATSDPVAAALWVPITREEWEGMRQMERFQEQTGATSAAQFLSSQGLQESVRFGHRVPVGGGLYYDKGRGYFNQFGRLVKSDDGGPTGSTAAIGGVSTAGGGLSGALQNYFGPGGAGGTGVSFPTFPSDYYPSQADVLATGFALNQPSRLQDLLEDLVRQRLFFQPEQIYNPALGFVPPQAPDPTQGLRRIPGGGLGGGLLYRYLPNFGTGFNRVDGGGSSQFFGRGGLKMMQGEDWLGNLMDYPWIPPRQPPDIPRRRPPRRGDEEYDDFGY